MVVFCDALISVFNSVKNHSNYPANISLVKIFQDHLIYCAGAE